ncbi:hypothetical protein AB0N05_24930 [Nocardia sp. NPDC051030]|uniref:hypothetical protein n=1 Tax=Nocardia sp. NPDC051030 TaxID=3155162 RepID=UPI00343F4E10
MERLRELRFAPLWVIVPMACAVLWGIAMVTGVGWFGVPLIVIFTPVFSVSLARERRRFGGRERMREFYECLRARQLPPLTTTDEAIRWNRLIIDERAHRRAGLAMSWFYLALATLGLTLPVLIALTSPHKGYKVGLTMPLAVVIAISGFAWIRFANPRVLAALETLAQQGTERGYGNWLTGPTA